MRAVIDDPRVVLFHGDSRELDLPPESIDAVVCDPPYELGFMGKGWDSAGVAFDPKTWAAFYRVMKPGAHLVAFGGSRTYHRIACAIEDAGFELRDSLMWLYGTGFPKSLDVSKAMDKRGGAPELAAVIGRAIKAARESRGLSMKECDARFCGGTTNWSWFEGRPRGQRAPTPATFALIAVAWPELAPLAATVDEVDREVTGQERGSRLAVAPGQGEDRSPLTLDITAPATDLARQWDGWGTALKPAFEPIILARKPLDGTVAASVAKWGTGALNVGACRIPTTDNLNGGTYSQSAKAATSVSQVPGNGIGRGFKQPEGRWPANVLLDEEAAQALNEQSGSRPGMPLTTKRSGKRTTGHVGFAASIGGDDAQKSPGYGDSGGASRFFYTAKTSRAERDLGCEALPPRTAGEATDRQDGTDGLESPRAGAGRTGGARNTHPTVKPIALMRWLCRLVTPPGGVVLDPFTGSGSTGMAALWEGFSFVGCELTDEYLPITEARIRFALTHEAPTK
jgi:hypothetical protein